MKIDFVRSGGFANVPLAVTLDTERMPEDAAKRVASMVAEVGFFGIPSVIPVEPTAADAFHYRITITTADGKHSADVVGAPPEGLRPLLRYLTNAAKAARRSRGP